MRHMDTKDKLSARTLWLMTSEEDKTLLFSQSRMLFSKLRCWRHKKWATWGFLATAAKVKWCDMKSVHQQVLLRRSGEIRARSGRLLWEIKNSRSAEHQKYLNSVCGVECVIVEKMTLVSKLTRVCCFTHGTFSRGSHSLLKFGFCFYTVFILLFALGGNLACFKKSV